MIGLMLVAATVMQPPKALVQYGFYGGVSCSNAWKPKFRQNAETYALGVWSGMNLAGSPRVGHSIPQYDALDRIKAECSAKPTELLTNAILHVYYATRRQGL